MNHTWRTLCGWMGVAGALCTPSGGQAQVPEEPWVGQARQVASSVPPRLLAVLTDAIQQAGPAQAIGVCQEAAPAMARAASAQTGWQIRRVSLGQRNPHASPDAWERDTLLAFERAQAAGADPAQLERAELVQEQGQAVRRYMRALPTQALCVQCHGTAAQLGPGVAQALQDRYPQDRGLGYSVGQIRGAMTLRQPVP